MPLHLRQYDCSNWLASLDRDLNAALNIRNYSETAASSAVEACGWDLPGKPDEAGSKRQLDLIKFEEVLQSGLTLTTPLPTKD